MRVPKREVKLDDIVAGQIIGDDPAVIAVVLSTHLALEALLLELAGIVRMGADFHRKSFPQKTKLLVDKGVLMAREQQAMDKFNYFRNDLAHIFGHRVTLKDALQLARELEQLGMDFSDSVGSLSETEAEDWYGGTAGVLQEIGWCLLFHAAGLLASSGGRDIFGTPAAPGHNS